jgi:lysozyme
MMENVLKSIAENEGFSPVAYPDPLSKGEPYTFGHGLTSITESESMEIVKNRVISIVSALSIKLPYFTSLPDDAKEVLIEMAYQLGVSGLLAFKNTLDMIKKGDFVGASKNMMLSRWASQTPKRALKLSRKLSFCVTSNIKG